MLRSFALVALFLPLAGAADWNGYQQTNFQVDGVNGYVVQPRSVAPGKPWLWRARFPEFHPEASIALLAKGYHLAYYDLPNIFGSPEAVEKWNHFYSYVIQHFGLSPKVSLEGVSRGGLFVYNWTLRNADKVNSIYCESPVCDMKSWPGGRGRGPGSPPDWKQALESYGFTEQQMLAFKGNPIDYAASLAKFKIPILHLVSEHDELAPPLENTEIFARRYREAGGPIAVHYNTSLPATFRGHHFPLDDPALEVNFILRTTPGMERLGGTGLTPEGVDYFSLREGLRNSLARFSVPGEARVAFLGGSITHMNGWRGMVCGYLQNRFPQTHIACIDAGIPSTGSTPGAFRLTRDVFKDGPVDLLIEEAAVNDSGNGFSAKEQLRGMEGIVRHAREINPNVDIALLYFVDPEKLASYRKGITPEVITSHQHVAEHYGLADLNLAREVTERIEAGEFSWEKDFKDLHPSPFGQTVYYRSVVRMLEAAWKDPVAPGVVAQPRALPPPLDEKSYYRGELVDIRQVKFDQGWAINPDWSPTDHVATRPGFVHVPMLVAEQPSATCHFTFEGTAVGILVAAGPDAGIVEYSIDGRPFQQQDLYTKWSRTLYIPWTYILDADLTPGSHELVLRIAAQANVQSTGHAVRIVNMLVN
jgi:pimeloyl-ACP methyl ester carboxylesterase